MPKSSAGQKMWIEKQDLPQEEKAMTAEYAGC